MTSGAPTPDSSTPAADGLPLFCDIQATQEATSPERGIFRYVNMHAAALARVPGAVRRFGIHPGRPAPAHLAPEILASGRVVPLSATELRRGREEGPFAYHVMAPFHVFHPFDAGLPQAGVGGTVPLVVTMYDLIPLTDPDLYLPRGYDRHVYDCRMRLVADADLVLALSRWTADQVVELLGVDADRVAVVGGGVSSAFHPVDDDGVRRELLAAAAPEVTKPFLLTVGFTDTRKNLELLVHVFAALPSDLRESLQVVVAGDVGPVYTEFLRNEVERCGLEPDVLVVPGRVSEAQLRAIYQSVALFVFPSRAEGFGLPVVEAIACGCPAIVADTSALTEILEWPPALFDASDADDLAQLVDRSIRDTAFRAELEAVCRVSLPRHTWDAVARRTIDAVDRLAPSARRLGGQHAPWRVAFAGRVDAHGSAEDAANARALRALAARLRGRRLRARWPPCHRGGACRRSGRPRLPVGSTRHGTERGRVRPDRAFDR